MGYAPNFALNLSSRHFVGLLTNLATHQDRTMVQKSLLVLMPWPVMTVLFSLSLFSFFCSIFSAGEQERQRDREKRERNKRREERACGGGGGKVQHAGGNWRKRAFFWRESKNSHSVTCQQSPQDYQWLTSKYFLKYFHTLIPPLQMSSLKNVQQKDNAKVLFLTLN